MSGHWPPEWEDPDDGFPDESDRTDTEADVRLSELAAYLASVPAPVLPDAVEARISAALAAESATRSVETADSGILRSRTLGRAPARARVRRSPGFRRREGSRRRGGFRAAMAIGPLLVCLLLAGVGYAVSRGVTSGTTESTAAAPAASSAAAAGPEPLAGSQLSGGGRAAQPEPLTPVRPGESPLFVVAESGTSYQRATLAEQVRATLIANGASQSTSAAVPSAASTPGSPSGATFNDTSGRAYSPPSGLLGCVLYLTNNALPRLVDRATYAGSPAYVIASSSRVWVVGLGCTATHPELIASALLAGLSRESSRPSIG
jgi:hypothetical protein